MKTFLKMLLASILGGGILIFLIFILFASLASISSPELEVQDNTVLRIDMNGRYVDRAQNNPFESIDPFSGEMESAIGLNHVLGALKAAKDDPKIKGVYLDGGIPLGGSATLKDIREALLDFKASGKFIYGYSEILTQKGLYLASVADSFMLNPEGIIEFSGLSASVTYYREALDNIGLKPVVLRATGNKFKSAVEPFLSDTMSAANRMQLTELLSSIWGQYLDEVSASANLSPAQLNSLADELLTDPKVAQEQGLIKGLAYKDQIHEMLIKAVEVDNISAVNFINPAKYASKLDINGSSEYNESRVAVIYAQGEIQGGEGSEYVIGSERIARAIREARKNSKVKAIVLRVNSPGGSALASEVIWREMDLARQEKPVIASMGDVAASGGYYIACYADTILAQENTVTGSIGAFGLFFTAEELMHDKIGINIETVKTNKHSDLGTIDRDLSPSERAILIRQVDNIYGTFKQRVAAGRGMDIALVDSLGQGRVYSGKKALELGLVDMMGGLDEAVAIAAEKAGISESYSVVNYPELEDPLQAFLKELNEGFSTSTLERELGHYAYYLELIQNAQSRQGFQTRLEFDLQID
ncbi:MAG: signal peptide peptidase SppA [Bacteroidetes bacterium]|nr:signal peptide peptidase SppA [Bacteroidota bacterium]